MIESLSQIDDSAIAIIGMSGRFPGAKNIDEFWQNLRDGVESIRRLSDEELLAEGVEPALLNNPNYVKANPFLEDADYFDASFFGYSPREATLIDPQQRLFLECAWSALEHAGYAPEAYPGAIGIYGGAGFNNYLINHLAPNFNLSPAAPATFYEVSGGNGADFLTTRVSYKLNLRGPSLDVQTACSTSLVALDLACEGLLEGKCKIALAGGVSLPSVRKTGYLYQEGLVLSPDGHCRAFDAKGQGMLGGNGVGIVVVKCLEDALADGDTIHAIIKGSAINNDGYLKIGFTAPSMEGQAGAISEAQEMAEVDPETITYIEAHGTATPLGDPIEIAALTKVFRVKTEKKGFCAIGSVKTNVGHLDAAAGIAGLIKTVLSLKHKQIPPSLNFESPNPEIDFENSPFYVNTKLTEWESTGSPRRAGVSSFGIGGTNAHVVLEEWKPLEERQKAEDRRQKTKGLLLLSAKTPTALEIATGNLANYLKQHPELNLGDVAYTLSVGRKAFDYRRIAVVSNQDEDVAYTLSSLDTKRVLSNSGQVKNRSVVFMFSGQGSQYVNMARELYETETYFQEQVDQCCDILQPHLGFNLRDILYPTEDQTETATDKLKQTAITQPALFVIEYALAKLWISWGIKPVAAIGHSIGEYVAATLAGVFSLEDALALVTARGQLMQSMQLGSMLAVPLAESEVKPLLARTSLEIATINSPTHCVVSGTTEAIEAFEKQLVIQEIEGRRLHTSHAFHSSMMKPILEPFTEKVKQVKLNPPTMPFVSNVTGTWITVEETTNPSYYAQHLRSCVRFADGVKQFFAHPDQILLEVGPGRTLSTLVKRHPDKPSEQMTLTSIRYPQEEGSDVSFLLKALGQLWLSGTQVDWANYYGEEKHYRVPLPTYPFERKRYWIDPPKQPTQETQIDEAKKPDIADWFYQPSWKRLNLPNTDKKSVEYPILLFVDELGLASGLVKRLKLEGDDVMTVQVGEEFCKISNLHYRLNPEHPHDYDTLVQELVLQKLTPKTIVHLWSVTPTSKLTLESVDKSQNLGFYSLLALTQALGRQNITDEMEIVVISNHLQEVTGEETITPEKATLLGCVKVISQENPNLHCRSIDIVLPSLLSQQENQLIEKLFNELQSNSSNLIIAYRHNHRWIQTFEPIQLEKPVSETPRLKQGGVYLITGGMGGIGLVLAEYLAKTVQAKLILTGRSPLPERDQWEQWLSHHDFEEKISQKIKKIQKLEALGAEVLVLSADVANQQQMKQAIAFAQNKFGQINGVIHAAGLPSGGVIQNKTQESIEAIFAAKVTGTLILDSLFKDTALDFFVCCSSLTSIVGGFGQVDYCGANGFLDAFAHYKQANNNTFTVAINWDAWQKVGMAVKTPKLQAGTVNNHSFSQKILGKGILPTEGANIFQRILNCPLPQVVVSTWDLSSRFNNYNVARLLDSDEDKQQTSFYQVKYQRPQLSNTYVAPRNELEEKVVQIWQAFLNIEKIGIYDDFFDLGGDSLLAIQLILKLQKELQLSLSVNVLLYCPTIESLCQSIQANSQANSSPRDLDRVAFKGVTSKINTGPKNHLKSPILNPQFLIPPSEKYNLERNLVLPSCLVELQKGNPQLPPLFLLHPIGGTVYFYRDLAQNLGSEQPVYGVQAQGVEGEAEALTTVEEMANYYIESIRQLQPHGPYLLGGSSFGGTLAFEMAQKLHQIGEQIPLLVMLDSPGPGQMPVKNLQTNAEIIFYYLTLLGAKNSVTLNELEQLSPEQQIIYFCEKQTDLAVMLNDLERVRHILQIFKVNMQAMLDYVPKEYPGKVLFFRAKEWDHFSAKHPEKAWFDLVLGGMDIYEVLGNHVTMNLAPQVKSLAQTIQKYIDEKLENYASSLKPKSSPNSRQGCFILGG